LEGNGFTVVLKDGDARTVAVDLGDEPDLDHQPTAISHRDPDWTRDELIITLDFYLRTRPTPPSKTSEPILDLTR
jgi:hypothetical protein